MARVAWKLNYVSPFLFSKPFINCDNQIQASDKKIKPKIWNRSSVISKIFLNKRFRIFNGKTFITLNVTSDMYGHRLGEFSVTKRLGHRGDIILRKKKNYSKRNK